ncbi:MAG: sigma-54-dependent transcriptional regulator [Fusobacteriaceae bacterium]
MNFLGFRLEENLRIELENVLDYDLIFSDNITHFLEMIKSKKFDAILIEEKKFQEEVLLNLIGKVVENQKKAITIILGETSNLNLVAGSLKAGAYDYILKPTPFKEIINIIEKSVKDHKLLAERVDKQKSSGDKLIGQTKEIVEVYKMIGKVAKSMVPVLIVGERGTGKTSVATAIHQFSENKNNPFISINCLALGSELVERKIFGYEKGAFQGAVISQIGDLEKLNNGTLHIGNIESLNLERQAKLLYFLQQGEFFRMGSAEPIKSNARVLASTNENLENLIIQGKFISELYSKLRVLEVNIPSLRERKADIPFIIDHYINRCNTELGTAVKGVSKPALKKILRYDWPGNVNELKNAIKSAVAISRGDSILLEELPSNVLGINGLKNRDDGQLMSLREWIRSETIELKKLEKQDYYENIISKVEKELIHQILELTNGKKVESAEILGITRNTLRTKMNNYNLE